MDGTPPKRDALATIDIIVRMIAVVLIPVVIVMIGNSYNNQQRKIEELRSANENAANRLTSLLKNFSSENPRERKMAVVISRYLAEHKQLPGELVQVLALIAETDTNKEVSNAAFISLATIAASAAVDTEKEQSRVASKIIRDMPGRIYIQVPDKRLIKESRRIDTLFSRMGYRVPPAEVVTVPVKRSEVRYFNKSDRAEAETIAASLQEMNIRAVPAFVPGFESKVRPRQFEIWISGK